MEINSEIYTRELTQHRRPKLEYLEGCLMQDAPY